MDNGKTGGKMEKFFAGKGYYIVLVLCIAVIGASVWSLASRGDDAAKANPKIEISDVIKNDDDSKKDRLPVIVTNPPQPTPEVKIDDAEVTGTVVSDTAPTSWVRPVVGQVDRAYSIETLAYDVTMKDWRTHDGIDISTDAGAVVRAAADGTVESIKQDDLYGTTVVIKHGGGIKTVYSNLAETPTVSEGDSVRAGDVIGSVGESALCEIGQPAHLHFAMSLDGVSVDPDSYLPPQ